MEQLTPRQIVVELDKYIIGQSEAKRAVAIALRNRYRRRQLPAEMRDEVTPKNILMIGPTGVGKTEIARRVAKLVDAPFIKVEATKFTEVGYVGRDVESIIRDLAEAAVRLVHDEKMSEVQARAGTQATERIVNLLVDQRLRAQAKHKGAGAVPVVALAEATRQVGGEATVGDEPAAVVPAPVAAARSGAPINDRTRRRQYGRIARQLAAQQLEEEQVDIEIESDNPFGPVGGVLEFVPGMSSDEMTASFQDFLDNFPQSPRRSRRVSVKEARRILTEEEAHKLIDPDSVVETALQRVQENGVVFIDEIDKITAPAVETGADVSGEGVQRDLLPIVEGSTVPTRYGPVKTDHILFIAAGAFHGSRPSDLIPELQGRFPLRVELGALSQEDLEAILTQPENALTKQYQALLATEEVAIHFTPDALHAIAETAAVVNERTEDIGARRLHTIMEQVLEELSFEADSRRGESISIDGPFVTARLEGLIEDEDLSRFIL
ncbi:MAG: ATP-dependent protease ATPase subunit HslU [Chloroflexota bacterium]|nr:ATP-dependent protease ATPase subunit HslU [Chloroflexota bacterium]